MAREFLRVTPETTPSAFNASGTAYIIDLDAANAYTVRPKPLRKGLRTAGASNLRAVTIAKKKELSGNLNWTIRGSALAVLKDWCVASAGVLKSYTVDHVLVMEDGSATKHYDRHLGVYVQQAQFSSGESDQFFKAQLQLTGMSTATITATDFPEPALADYPADAFLTFEDGSGGLTLHSETRVDIETFNLTIKNMLDPRFFVAATPQLIKYCGRDVDWTSRVSYKSTIPRTDFEAQTPIAAAITFNNGTNTVAFDMKSANYYGNVQDQLDVSKLYLQELTLEAHLDYTAGVDFSMTVT